MTLMACARSSRKPHSALPFVSLLAAAVGITLYPSESRATQTCTASVRAELGGDSSCVVDVSYELSTPCPPSGGGGGGYSVSLMAGTGQPDPACLGTPCAPGNSLSPGTTHVSGTSRWIFSEPQYVRFSFHAQGGGQYCGDGFTCTVESAPLVVCNGTVFKPAQGAIEYHHVDALGSTRMVTDANGAVVARYDYLPFGEEIPSGEWQRTDTLHYGGANNVLQRFTGQIRDDESGLDYFGARYFSSQQGRFMSPDKPLMDQHRIDPQSWNLYAYGRNNPLRYVDPGGEAVELLGNTDEERRKNLAFLQNAVGNKAAAGRLYINAVGEGKDTRYFVGIRGDVGDFMNLSGTAHDLANVVIDKRTVEFGLTDRDLSGYGGAATFDVGETSKVGAAPNQNVRVWVNPQQAESVGDSRLRFSLLGVGRFGGQDRNPAWTIQPLTDQVAAWHEFGHSWGFIHGRTTSRNSGPEAAEWENRMRQQLYGNLGPKNAPRVFE